MILKKCLLLGLSLLFGIAQSNSESCYVLTGVNGQYWQFCTEKMNLSSANSTCIQNGMRLAKTDDDSQLDLKTVLEKYMNQSISINQVIHFYKLFTSSIDSLRIQQLDWFDYLDNFLDTQYRMTFSRMSDNFTQFHETLSNQNQKDQVKSLNATHLNNFSEYYNSLDSLIATLKSSTHNAFLSMFLSLETNCLTSLTSLSQSMDIVTDLKSYQLALGNLLELISHRQSQFANNIVNFQTQLNVFNTNMTNTVDTIYQANFIDLKSKIFSLTSAFFGQFNPVLSNLQSENTKEASSCRSRLTYAKTMLHTTLAVL